MQCKDHILHVWCSACTISSTDDGGWPNDPHSSHRCTRTTEIYCLMYHSLACCKQHERPPAIKSNCRPPQQYQVIQAVDNCTHQVTFEQLAAIQDANAKQCSPPALSCLARNRHRHSSLRAPQKPLKRLLCFPEVSSQKHEPVLKAAAAVSNNLLLAYAGPLFVCNPS